MLSLWLHLVTHLVVSAPLLAAPGEFLLELQGFRTHAEFLEIRQKLEESLPEGAYLVERKMSRGTVQFVIRPASAAEDLLRSVRTTEFEAGKLTILRSDASIISVKYEPMSSGKIQ